MDIEQTTPSAIASVYSEQLPFNGTPSKFQALSEKYDIVTSTTGYDIYHDDEFKITDSYLEFMSDYNRLIHREIQQNNHKGIYSLCNWIYYCDRAFPWFDPMMEAALKNADIRTFTLVYWMRSTWYEERYDDLTHDELREYAANSQDETLKLELLAAIHCLDKQYDDDDETEDDAGNTPSEVYWNLKEIATSKFFTTKLYYYGVNTAKFGENSEAVQKGL